ncbi:MAG: sodium pump decarboxylase gamma subunit [Clostridiales bacterium]|nr:sodium pump decarboxylase gamma subunit [Clostridiales bacterium]
MIMEALKVMLFGMLGIFVVMGVIIGVIYLLKAVSKKT